MPMKFLFTIILSVLFQTNQPNDEKLDFYKKAGVSSYFEMNYELSMKKLGYVLRFRPKDDEAHYYRALCKYDMENYSGAIYELNKALEINPKKAEYYYLKGRSLYNNAKFEAALFTLNEAIKLDANNGEAFYIRASCHKHEGNMMGACEDLFEAADLNIELADKKIKKYCTVKN